MIDWSQIHTAEQKADEALSAALSSATTRNNNGYESAIAAMTADYPPSEIATWERQRAEVKAWEANSAAPTPWIDGAASARGIDRTLYLSKTLEKANQFAQASAYLTGTRQRYESQIQAAVGAAALNALQFNYAMPSA